MPGEWAPARSQVRARWRPHLRSRHARTMFSHTSRSIGPCSLSITTKSQPSKAEDLGDTRRWVLHEAANDDLAVPELRLELAHQDISKAILVRPRDGRCAAVADTCGTLFNLRVLCQHSVCFVDTEPGFNVARRAFGCVGRCDLAADREPVGASRARRAGSPRTSGCAGGVAVADQSGQRRAAAVSREAAKGTGGALACNQVLGTAASRRRRDAIVSAAVSWSAGSACE